MKKIIIYISAIIFVTSCSENASNNNIDKVLETKDIAKIKELRLELQSKYDNLSNDISKIDAALAALDTINKTTLVTVKAVKDTVFTHYVDIQGNVETKQNILVYPEFSGTLVSLSAKAGQQVSKGQVLGKIDDGGLSSQLAQVEVQATLAKTTFERQKNLWNQKIGSEIQYLQAKANYEAQLKVASQIKSQIAKTYIKAPFSGVIDNVEAERGQIVSPGMPLMRIVNLSNMYVSAEIPENYVGKLKAGSKVNVFVQSVNKNYNGVVRAVGNFINPNNRNFTIEVSIPNKDNLLRPNQVAILKIEDYKNDKAILVQDNIITENATGEKMVYIVENKNDKVIAIKKLVEIGLSDGKYSEIKSGLKSGDLIIIDGARTVNNGDAVEITK